LLSRRSSRLRRNQVVVIDQSGRPDHSVCLCFLWGVPHQSVFSMGSSDRIFLSALTSWCRRCRMVANPSPKPPAILFGILACNRHRDPFAAIVVGWVMGLFGRHSSASLIGRLSRRFVFHWCQLALYARVATSLGIRTDAGMACLCSDRRYFPFFGTLLGWVGRCSQLSDTISTANLAIAKSTRSRSADPVEMAAANVVVDDGARFIDAKSIVVCFNRYPLSVTRLYSSLPCFHSTPGHIVSEFVGVRIVRVPVRVTGREFPV